MIPAAASAISVARFTSNLISSCGAAVNVSRGVAQLIEVHFAVDVWKKSATRVRTPFVAEQEGVLKFGQAVAVDRENISSITCWRSICLRSETGKQNNRNEGEHGWHRFAIGLLGNPSRRIPYWAERSSCSPNFRARGPRPTIINAVRRIPADYPTRLPAVRRNRHKNPAKDSDYAKKDG